MSLLAALADSLIYWLNAHGLNEFSEMICISLGWDY